MTADFWGRLFLTSWVGLLVGFSIFGISSQESENYPKLEAGRNVGGLLFCIAALSALISAVGYIWTAR